MKLKYPKGSEWRKWDLHVHTPASALNNQFEGTDENEKWDKYFAKLASLADISVLGLTDYFSIEGYKKVQTYKDSGHLSNIDYLLPNVELRIVPVTSEDTPINLHIIFSPAPEILDGLDSKFFSSLEFTYQGEVFKCIRGDLINLGRKYKNDNTIQENIAYKIGIEQFKISFDKIKEIITKDRLLQEKSLVVVSNRSEDGASGIQHSSLAATREGIYRFANCIFSSNPSDRDYFLGKGADTIEDIIRKYGGLKPCIHGSDAHSLDKVCCPDLSRFAWIKADPTFEGLKQIIYEPDLRVKIQQENPIENETYAKVETCVVNFPTALKIKTEDAGKKTDFCFQDKYELVFSNNLTSIIGGRGSGKSTLVHLLYNAWPKMNIEKLDKDNLNSPLISLDLPPDPLKQVAKLTTTEIPIDTEFFLQNEIEKIAKDVDEMSELIRHRLFLLSFLDNQKSLKDLQYEWTLASHGLNELIEAYDNVSTINQEIELLKKQIETLKKQTAVIKSEEYKEFQKEIEDINKEISAFKNYKDEYTKLTAKIDMLIAEIAQLSWNEEQGKSILVDLLGSLQNYEKSLKEKYSSLEEKFKENNFTEQIAKKKLQLKKYLTEKGLAEENIEELANATEQIKQMEDEIKELEKQKAPYEKNYSERNSRLTDYENKYSTYHERFFEVVSRLQKELEGLPFFDKAISFASKTNEKHLREAAVDFVKQNSPAKGTLKGSLRTDDFQAVLFDVDNIADYLKDKEKIRTCVNQSTKTFLHRQVLQELVNNPVFLEKLYLRLWRDYYDIDNIQVQTKLGEKLLQNTSFGERCGLVMSIVLVAGTNPIVIDQPEDNLDGKFISTVLVPLIKKRKHYRQIILVTRDANIVIGGDAELIHILEGDGQKTKIIPSTIENIEHREKYIWILDGGKEAFEKREKKYGFKS